MNDYEIQEIRRIRQQISAENGNDLKAVAKYYRQIEEELKNSGKYRFVEKGYNHNRRQPPEQIRIEEKLTSPLTEFSAL